MSLLTALKRQSAQAKERKENPLITWQAQEASQRRIERNSRIFWTVFWLVAGVAILFLAREYAVYLSTKIGGK